MNKLFNNVLIIGILATMLMPSVAALSEHGPNPSPSEGACAGTTYYKYWENVRTMGGTVYVERYELLACQYWIKDDRLYCGGANDPWWEVPFDAAFIEKLVTARRMSDYHLMYINHEIKTGTVCLLPEIPLLEDVGNIDFIPELPFVPSPGTPGLPGTGKILPENPGTPMPNYAYAWYDIARNVSAAWIEYEIYNQYFNCVWLRFSTNYIFPWHDSEAITDVPEYENCLFPEP